MQRVVNQGAESLSKAGNPNEYCHAADELSAPDKSNGFCKRFCMGSKLRAASG